jgi:hypothetical protein
MGLLKNLFGGGKGPVPPQSSQFHESETTAQSGSPNAPRRELVQVVLRDTMRKHGIPSDWMDCRILSVVTRKQVAGMHVQFVVRKGQTRLLGYVQAFQDGFWREIEKFEPRAREWLFSLSWEFDEIASQVNRSMPGPGGWSEADTQPGGDTQPPDLRSDELASDLEALYAIRDAALAQPAEPTAPGSGAAAPSRRTGPGDS